MGFHEKVDDIIEESIELMKSAGAEIIDPIDIEGHHQVGDAGYYVMLYEFKHGLNNYLSSRTGIHVRTLEELIEFNKEHRESSMPYFEQERLDLSQAMGDLSDRQYKDALEKVLRLSREEGIDKTLQEYEVDAIIAPTGGPAWPIDKINGDHFRGGSSSPAARSGYPSISIPAGYVHGLPVNISLFSGAWERTRTNCMAYAFEQMRGPRQPPRLVPTLELP